VGVPIVYIIIIYMTEASNGDILGQTAGAVVPFRSMVGCETAHAAVQASMRN